MARISIHEGEQMSSRWSCTGAVLSGGSSQRMGIIKENLVLPDGTTLIDSVISALDELCDKVVVVGNESYDRVIIKDLRPGVGPLGGIEALLASGIDSQYLVCPNDIPLATSEVLIRLLEPTDALATIFATNEGHPFQSLPLRISPQALDVVSSALDRGEGAIHRVLSKLETKVVAISEAEALSLTNINTMEDYKRLLAGLA